MPKSTYTHKSMLLRGIKFDAPALDRADIEATKGRANHSGRSHGGAPLRGGHNGRGRGGQISYSESRPNPFAAHINPGYPPSGGSGSFRGGPVPHPGSGWAPTPPGQETFQRGPPPPPGRGYNYGPPQPTPPVGYYNGQPQQPQHNHYMNMYGNHAPNNNYYPPPPVDRNGGYNDRNGR